MCSSANSPSALNLRLWKKIDDVHYVHFQHPKVTFIQVNLKKSAELQGSGHCSNTPHLCGRVLGAGIKRATASHGIPTRRPVLKALGQVWYEGHSESAELSQGFNRHDLRQTFADPKASRKSFAEELRILVIWERVVCLCSMSSLFSAKLLWLQVWFRSWGPCTHLSSMY